MNDRGHVSPLVVHGWTIFVHPLFLAQLEALAAEVDALRRKDPAGYTRKNASKRLAAITKLAFDVIPQDPARPEYRQGGALGDGYRHWFRAKFFQQYRLFFRYHASSKVIVYAWVNDEATLSPGGDLRRALGHLHPSSMGGEYLPDRRDTEVEIAW
jgi:toxin YhaV